MGAEYEITLPLTAVSVALDLAELTAPALKSIRLKRIGLSSSGIATQQLRYTIRRVTGAPTIGSGGAAATPQGVSSLFADPSMTVTIFNTTRLTGGTQVQFRERHWNPLVGTEWVAADDAEKIETEGATILLIGLEDAPSPAVNITGSIIVEVIG